MAVTTLARSAAPLPGCGKEAGPPRGSPWRDRAVSCAFLILSIRILLPAEVAASAPAQGFLAVKWEREHLSVTADDVPLGQVMEEVARRTGLEARGIEALEEPVSANFSGLSLRDGLQRLLAGESYVFVEGSTAEEGSRAGVVLILKRRSALPESGSFRGESGPADDPGEGVGVGASSGVERVVAEGEPGPEADPASRLGELQTFANLGDLESLAKAVDDGDQMVQATAVELLAERDPDLAVGALAAATKSEHAETRFHALRLLDQRRQTDDRTLRSTLVEALTDPDAAVRVYAMQVLLGRDDPAALKAMHRALRDPDVSVRLYVLESLVRRDDGRALLHEALSDSDESVRFLAASALQQTDPEGR